MQLVLLAAGRGSRLNLNVTNKCFAKVCDKYLLDYNLEQFLDCNLNEIIIIVGHNARFIIDYLGNSYHNIPITYVKQEELLGIAHAIKIATPYIYDTFIMCLSDELFIDHTIKNIQKSYTIDVAGDGTILHLIEKPSSPYNNWKGTGCCIMNQSMLTILKKLQPNPVRKEYEMGDWIQLAIDNRYKCKMYPIALVNFNLNTQKDIELAELNIKKRRKLL